MDRILIFANPISGRGRGLRAARQIEEELRRRGYHVTTVMSRAESASLGPEARAAKAAIVIGGDGTLRGVAQWALDSPGGKPPCPLLIVPTGTANLMGKHLGIQWDDERIGQQVAAALERHRIVHLDAARISDGIFLLMAGVGFDAAVIHELERLRSGPIGIGSYIRPLLRAAASYRFPPLSVRVDGRVVFESAAALAMVGNIREYGTGFAVLPDARPDDGVLDVCVMPCASMWELAELTMAAAAGEHTLREGVVYVKGRRVSIESAEGVPVQVDGEAAGTTPLEIELMEAKVGFVVPGERVWGVGVQGSGFRVQQGGMTKPETP
jgi:diacylglycerol kinase (ATP)